MATQITDETVKAVVLEIQQRQRERNKIQTDFVNSELEKHRKTILRGFRYDLTDDDEYNAHAKMVQAIGNNLMLREFRRFEIDEHNKQVLRFLTYYFNGCNLAESVFPNENYKVHKQLLIIGEPGTGKTMLMQIFSEYMRMLHHENQYKNISLTQLMNYHKMHGHIDKYTYNEGGAKDEFEGAPFSLCLHDLGLATENQKSFGTLLSSVLDEFLFARYEIFQQSYGAKRCHITSNLSVRQLKQGFEDRLVDRFKAYNVIELHGPSRRK